MKSKIPSKSEQTNAKIVEYIKESEKEINQKEEEINIEIPQQAEFFKTPIRFGNIPVDKLPLGCDEKEQYRKIYPKIALPFQTVFESEKRQRHLTDEPLTVVRNKCLKLEFSDRKFEY